MDSKVSKKDEDEVPVHFIKVVCLENDTVEKLHEN